MINLSLKDSLIDSLDGAALSVYLELESVYYSSNESKVAFQIPNIGYFYYGSVSLKSSQRRFIKRGLDILANHNLLSCSDDKNYFLDTSIFKSDNERFRQIPLSTFLSLRKEPGLLKHYLQIIKSRNASIEIKGLRGIVGTMPISFFADIEHVSKRTIINYNQSLEDMKLIYIRRANYNFEKESRECNVYSLYEHRGLVDSYVGYYNKDNNSKANFRRKVSAMYNCYKKNPNCYTLEQIEQLRKDLDKYNAEMLELGGDYLKKIKTID